MCNVVVCQDFSEQRILQTRIRLGGNSEMGHIDTVRNFIVENFLFNDGDVLNEDTSFMEQGIIDSTGIMELIFFIEETFGFGVEDDELIPENMDSLQNIARFIDRKQKTNSAKGATNIE